jgi:hypothetical protein
MSLLLPICFGLGACGEGEAPSKQPSELQDRMKADADLMVDIGRAGTELERRLSETVRAQDGIVIIHSPVTGQYMSQVLSPNTAWVLSCGAGISIIFGSSVSGAEGSTSNDVEVNLAYNTVRESDVLRWHRGWVSASMQFSAKRRSNSCRQAVIFPRVGSCQISKSRAARDGVMGFHLVDGGKVVVYQIDGADRERQRQRES